MAISLTILTMGEQLVPDELWAAIQPPSQGRPALDGRPAVLGGIIYVLRAGCPDGCSPAEELGCGSGVTCWRLRDCVEARESLGPVIGPPCR
jgi:transposase